MRLSCWNNQKIPYPLAEKYPGVSSYTYCINNPVNLVDPDGRDIIFLIDSGAVSGLGHAAVLIGNDKDGWRYYSMNGTGEGSKPKGESKYADLGNIKYNSKTGKGNDFRGTEMKWQEVVKAVNTSNPNEIHNYDGFVMIETSSSEDKIAANAAKSQAGGKIYGIFGSSCIDVPQEAIKSVFEKRMGKEATGWQEARIGDNMLFPNDYYNNLNDNKGEWYEEDGFIRNMNEFLEGDGKTNEFKAEYVEP